MIRAQQTIEKMARTTRTNFATGPALRTRSRTPTVIPLLGTQDSFSPESGGIFSNYTEWPRRVSNTFALEIAVFVDSAGLRAV